MASRLQDKTEQLAAKRRELHDIFAAGGEDMDLNEEQVKDVQARNDELGALGKEVEDLRALDDTARRNKAAMDEAERLVRRVPHAAGQSDQPGDRRQATGDRDQPAPRKSIGELFTESRAYKEYNPSNNKGPITEVAGVSLKTLMTTTSDGFPPQAIRTGQVILSAQQQPRIVDVVPSATTTQIAVVFMREIVFDNAAAERDEAAGYPEAGLEYQEASETVRKIAVFLPITDEQLADIDGMQDRVNNRLTLMIRQRLDQQIIAGDASPPNLNGILASGRSDVQEQARGTDPNVDAAYKALTKLRSVGFVEPNAFLFHPNDYQNIRLLRTADGIYLFGPPSDPGVERLWGLPVVQSTYVTEHTAVTGDFQGYSELNYKAGLEFEVSNSHSDFFVTGKLAIRCQLRCALVLYRESAFCKVTGL